jgi:hypothetical protein
LAVPFSSEPKGVLINFTTLVFDSDTRVMVVHEGFSMNHIWPVILLPDSINIPLVMGFDSVYTGVPGNGFEATFCCFTLQSMLPKGIHHVRPKKRNIHGQQSNLVGNRALSKQTLIPECDKIGLLTK